MEYNDIRVEENEGIGKIVLNKEPLNVLDIARSEEHTSELQSH